MKNHQTFLQFNNTNILFINIEGVYWVALKPILDALNMDADRAIKTLKKDPILSPERSLQPVQVSKNGKNQLRNMTCLPEKYIYGWIFSLRSDNKELVAYKKTCYDLLYKHFHGTITNRKELLLEKQNIAKEIHTIKVELKEKEESYLKLEALETKRKGLNTKLNKMDAELIKQPELFN